MDWLGGHVPDGRCLVVKLGLEVCDLSEDMRIVLEKGTVGVVDRLTRCIEEGRVDRSISLGVEARSLANSLCPMWLGTTLQAKIDGTDEPFDIALAMTERLWG